jgi:hypothetical protein
MRTITADHQPDVRPIRDAGFLWGKPWYRVQSDWELEYNGILILARKHYGFDGASVPRLCWGLMGYTPDGLHRAGALAHDIGCDREGMLITGAAIGRPEYPAVLLGDSSVRITLSTFAGQMESDEVHQMFRDILDHTEGSRPRKNKIFHGSVRAFGPRWPTLQP